MILIDSFRSIIVVDMAFQSQTNTLAGKFGPPPPIFSFNSYFAYEKSLALAPLVPQVDCLGFGHLKERNCIFYQ